MSRRLAIKAGSVTGAPDVARHSSLQSSFRLGAAALTAFTIAPMGLHAETTANECLNSNRQSVGDAVAVMSTTVEMKMQSKRASRGLQYAPQYVTPPYDHRAPPPVYVPPPQEPQHPQMQQSQQWQQQQQQQQPQQWQQQAQQFYPTARRSVNYWESPAPTQAQNFTQVNVGAQPAPAPIVQAPQPIQREHDIEVVLNQQPQLCPQVQVNRNVTVSPPMMSAQNEVQVNVRQSPPPPPPLPSVVVNVDQAPQYYAPPPPPRPRIVVNVDQPPQCYVPPPSPMGLQTTVVVQHGIGAGMMGSPMPMGMPMGMGMGPPMGMGMMGAYPMMPGRRRRGMQMGSSLYGSSRAKTNKKLHFLEQYIDRALTSGKGLGGSAYGRQGAASYGGTYGGYGSSSGSDSGYGSGSYDSGSYGSGSSYGSSYGGGSGSYSSA